MRIARIMGFVTKATLEKEQFMEKTNVCSFIAKHVRNVSLKPGVPPFLEANIHARPFKISYVLCPKETESVPLPAFWG
jgi:hypothetical protein